MQTLTLGRVEYAPTYAAMQAFNTERVADTPDQLWVCEHPPVYTHCRAGDPVHLAGIEQNRCCEIFIDQHPDLRFRASSQDSRLSSTIPD